MRSHFRNWFYTACWLNRCKLIINQVVLEDSRWFGNFELWVSRTIFHSGSVIRWSQKPVYSCLCAPLLVTCLAHKITEMCKRQHKDDSFVWSHLCCRFYLFHKTQLSDGIHLLKIEISNGLTSFLLSSTLFFHFLSSHCCGQVQSN